MSKERLEVAANAPKYKRQNIHFKYNIIKSTTPSWLENYTSIPFSTKNF